MGRDINGHILQRRQILQFKYRKVTRRKGKKKKRENLRVKIRI